MTYRYRCGFCDVICRSASQWRGHLFVRHEKALIQGLGLIEGFGTQKVVE